MNTQLAERHDDLTVTEIVQRWADPAWRETIDAWAVTRCEKLRQQVLASATDASEVPPSDGSTRSAGIEDLDERFLSRDEFVSLRAISLDARRQWSVPPPESPSPAEAYYWLIRAHVLTLLMRYAHAITVAIAFQRGLRVARPGEPTFEIDNLLCEPCDDDLSAFLWIGVLSVLYNATSNRPDLTCSLQNLILCFGNVADIFYNLTDAVYSTDLVLECRRAYSAFWRRVGGCAFIPFWETFVEKRHALDEAIRKQKAGRFSSVEKSLDQMAAELVNLRQSLKPLMTAPTATAKAVPPEPTTETTRRGPKGSRKSISVKYAAQVYNVSPSTICNWDKGEGCVPVHYPGRDVSIDDFNRAAAADLAIIGHKQGVITRVTDACRKRKR